MPDLSHIQNLKHRHVIEGEVASGRLEEADVEARLAELEAKDAENLRRRAEEAATEARLNAEALQFVRDGLKSFGGAHGWVPEISRYELRERLQRAGLLGYWLMMESGRFVPGGEPQGFAPGWFWTSLTSSNAHSHELRKMLAEWAQNPSGVVVLHGPVGSGKSHLALNTLKERRLNHLAGNLLFAEARDIVQARDDQVDELADVDILAIDDLGVELDEDPNLPGFKRARLQKLIHLRWFNSKPTLVTTNLDPSDIAKRYGSRTASRLLASARILEIQGVDLRLNPPR